MAYEFDNVIEENNETLNIQSDITSKPSNKSNKVNIIHIVKDNISITKLNEIVNELHLLRMLTTHHLKLFILKQKFEGKKIKIKNYINEGFIIVLMETIASNKNDIPRRMSGRVRKLPKLLEELYSIDIHDADDSSLSDDDIMDKNEARKQLLAFINDVVLEEGIDEENGLSQDIKEMILNGIDIKCLQNTIRWIAQEIVTSYQQNIIQNYKTYIERFVNVFYLRSKKAELEAIENSGVSKEEKKDEKRVLLLKYRNVKDDLVEPSPAKYKSKSTSALEFIKAHKRMLFPKSR
jgi:hypothetical protein